MAEKRGATEREVNELLDNLLEGRSPEEIMGGGGLLDALTKRVMERERWRPSSPTTWATRSTRERAATAATRGTGVRGSG